ncbi:UDP-glucose/GDP-mannose dehydrogenase family protein [Treponema lecithinolyticum]|uniref:UDP-glucose dehydrogenase family protein n=1 Tax=Treponema lecithinolyticum TaxID=53418 RepID=UPI0028E77CD1|nr:UDP-glucose/GDP-mannose dehydrogenase family protein [Treponema lecithinolyticum]
MNLSIVGTGYVGLVTGTCFAEMGNTVWCIDIDEVKIENLKKGILPIYEPALEEMVARNYKEGRLHFTTDYAQAVPQSKICFIAVGTPPGEDGSADVSYVLAAARSIAQQIKEYTVIVDKSTVPVGTSEKVRDAVQKVLDDRQVKIDFDVVSNPEFLKEGVAVDDFLRPDRVVIGTDSEQARSIMQELYEPFVSNGHPLLVMDIKSAEITKYAANAMLATRISFMNEIAKLCDTLGGDVKAVRQGIGTDSRIGMSFLYAGCGYGGSCFPKDVKELIAVGKRNNIDMKIAQAVEQVNEEQKHILVQQIIKKYGENLTGKTFALWGLAFKPQTDDMREAPSIVIINELVKRGAHIRAYDPEAYQTAKHYLNHIAHTALSYEKDMWTPLSSADALILVTEWKQFRQPDFDKIKQSLKTPVIFDGRNQYSITLMKELGIEYHCIGRNV